uniref:Uncharacterized protein n=1 Tax=Arundo donax TaxID=35708 RepID=A0A0A9DMS9_ARUDO
MKMERDQEIYLATVIIKFMQYQIWNPRFFLHTLLRSLFHSSTRIPSLSAFPEVYRFVLLNGLRHSVS